MVRYFCHNCNNMLLKQINTVIEHIWGKHGVEVKKYPNRAVFLCKACSLPFGSITLFLNHLDKTHAIHIWYEKGLTKRRVFFDGTLDENLANETKRNEAVSIQKYYPISQAPFDFNRFKEAEEENKNIVVEKKMGNCARCRKLRVLIDGRVCKSCHKLGF